MKGRRFEITLASPEPAGASRRFAEELARVCDRFVGWPEATRDWLWIARRYLSVFSPLPISVASDRSETGQSTLAGELGRKPDIVVADFPHATVLLPSNIGTLTLLFTHNVEAEIFRRHAEVAPNRLRRAIWESQARKMTRLEDDAARRFNAIVAVSERDARYFRGVCGHDRVFAIPTGVDLDYFRYEPEQATVAADGGSVVFTGSMDWLANLDGVRYFMDKVWPHITRARPKAKMVVVGHSPPRSLVQAARDRGLAWTFTGFVDDVRPYVTDADVYVIPLRVGGGTRIKAYEAMAMGRPGCFRHLPRVEGVPVTPGHDCLIANSDEAIGGAVLRLLGDARERHRLAENARKLVERFSAQAAAAVFEDACLQASAAGRPGCR